jgi:YHS domain-containing protein
MKSRDPVCGMTVDTESAAARSSYLETDYVFCSIACQQTFEAHPEQFAPGSQTHKDAATLADSRPRDNPPFTKADGIVAPMFGSAGSGGLEYDPSPEQRKE